MERAENLPDLPLYHANSSLAGRSGYYPNINTTQLQAVEALDKKLKDNNCILPDDGEFPFFKLLRFLRARKFNVDNAFDLLTADMTWRSEDGRLDLNKKSAREILGCDPLLIYQYFPNWLQGIDKEGRPVSYRHFGKFETWSVLKLIDMATLIRFHSWECEMALRVAQTKSQSENLHIETFCLIVDAAGWGVRLATSDAFTFIKNMVSTDSNHYPERLGCMIIINAPSALSWAYGVIQTFMDEVTKAKIKILGARSQWGPVLKTLIDEDQIPAQYGGSAPDLTPEQAIASLDPPPLTEKDDEATMTAETTDTSTSLSSK